MCWCTECVGVLNVLDFEGGSVRNSETEEHRREHERARELSNAGLVDSNGDLVESKVTLVDSKGSLGATEKQMTRLELLRLRMEKVQNEVAERIAQVSWDTNPNPNPNPNV